MAVSKTSADAEPSERGPSIASRAGVARGVGALARTLRAPCPDFAIDLLVFLVELLFVTEAVFAVCVLVVFSAVCCAPKEGEILAEKRLAQASASVAIDNFVRPEVMPKCFATSLVGLDCIFITNKVNRNMGIAVFLTLNYEV